MTEPLQSALSLKVSPAGAEWTTRVVPEEMPIALVYDGTTHAVMMATPADLEDFALGFSLSEGKIEHADDISEVAVIVQEAGIELRMWLNPRAGHRIAARRRALLGPTGCGLCGVESLAAALPELPKVGAHLSIDAEDIAEAVASVVPRQVLNSQARALHAAGFWTPKAGLVELREDVGRHNALDKLVGAITRANIDPAGGVVIVTSRVSVEMVQKAAFLGAPLIVAASAPTALAVRSAEAAGITLVAVARADGFEVFAHPVRIVTRTPNERAIRLEIKIHAAC